MKLRTGLKALIGISVLGIGVAVLLIYTCPFAGQIAFSTLVREVPMEHDAGAAGHTQQHGTEAEKPHEGMEKHQGVKEKRHEDVQAHSEAAQKPHAAVAERHKESEGLKVHLMVIPDVRSYPVKETKLFGIDVSPLGIIVLLLLMALCFFILGQRPLNLFAYSVTPKAMGVAVLLITLWNLIFAAFLLGVEVVQLKEL